MQTAGGKFGELINGDIPVLVDMFATWCGPCKMLEPNIKQVAQRMTGKIKVLKLDIDKNPHVAKAYQVMLFQDLLIPVTSFFMDPASLGILCLTIFPVIINEKY